MKIAPLVCCTLLVGCVAPWPGTTPTDKETGLGTPPLLEDAKVAMELPGPVGDHGWSFAHNEGLLYAVDQLDLTGSRVNEAVETGELAQQIEDDIAAGYNVIYTASSDYISITQQKAVEHPEVYFVSCCGQVYNDNLTSYFGRMYQPLYLSAFLAASVAGAGDDVRLGVVSSKPFPELVRHINAITLGARQARPNAVVDIRFIDSFFDPPLEAQFSRDLLDNGAVALVSQTDTTIMVQEVAARRDRDGVDNLYSIAYDNPDACGDDEPAPGCITSAYWNWGPLYTQQIGSLLDGTWDPTDVEWRPMTNDSDSIVNLSTTPNGFPTDIVGEMTDLKTDLIENTQKPFVGPIRDNKGVQQVDGGDEMTDLQLDTMCWFVEGVVDSSSGVDVPAVVPQACGGDFRD